MGRRLAITLALAAFLAGCGHFPPSPGEITQNYVSAVAEGNYQSACALLDGHAREALQASMRSNHGCPVLLARCLPTNPSVLQHDQAQLFYANVATTVDGAEATVRTSGTAVARRIRELTLAKERGHWVLTSYGKQRCRAVPGRAKRARR